MPPRHSPNQNCLKSNRQKQTDGMPKQATTQALVLDLFVEEHSPLFEIMSFRYSRKSHHIWVKLILSRLSILWTINVLQRIGKQRCVECRNCKTARERETSIHAVNISNSSPSTLSSPMINSTHLSDCKSQQSQVNCTCNSEVNNQSQTYNHHTPVGLPLAVIDNHLNTILADGNAHPRFKSLSKTLILELV
ncbi:hypothetical protein GJ496_002540 [Pomphorhynchus laevis]|nr:hypothetical protein GJ496_002540 [Pomphorhynchus laevis]